MSVAGRRFKPHLFIIKFKKISIRFHKYYKAKILDYLKTYLFVTARKREIKI